ncbi:helix-hairpin-helix domain-containing protein [Candidatus Bipolaricaulota bacterium]|nr:helix-hairpin-helix domain-containing protein [Candidatus Bipolaricaulota bacterium]
MSTNKKCSMLLRVVLVLVLVGVGVAGGYYLWGRSPVPQAFFVRLGTNEVFPVRDGFLSLISSARQEVLVAQMEEEDIVWLEEALASVSADTSVRIIITPKNSTKFSQLTGMGFKIEPLDTQGALHHKFIVVDGKTVLTGSDKWWGNAVLVTNTTVAESFRREFDYLWDLTKPPAASEPDWDKKSCLERLNAARFADLVPVKGIGGIRALRILEYRESHGNFSTVDELTEVYDIGPALRTAILEKLGCSTP